MCGIAGILRTQGPIAPEVLGRMTDALAHRGPDDAGLHADVAASGAGVGLGFRRLSIIDLAGGHQPMANEDGSVWIVFNGEIYNFQDLRPDLESRGHVFRTRSDTETLLHSWEEYGLDCLAKLNGMFAFALWDRNRETLLLARDRLGKKPLYWIDTGRELLFASEPKALLQHPAVKRDIDPVALSKYLLHEYVPAPHAIFAGMHKLPAAHFLRWERGRITVQRYWDLCFGGEPPRRSAAEYAAELRERLRESVRLRLVSDVPLGVFLSGGLDSSSIVATMAELVPTDRIKTFSIGFEDPSFDEAAHARRVAQHFGTDHREDILRASTLVDILPEVVRFLDEPFADASIVPTYLLSQFTRQHVTVALGGDGGDELLAGYPTFQAERAARLYRVPRLLHERLVLPLAGRLPVSTDNFSFDFKVKRFLHGVHQDPGVRNQVWLGAFERAAQERLLVDPTPCASLYADL
jgi:asparagine synthase (glutamine-hydrolysing)